MRKKTYLTLITVGILVAAASGHGSRKIPPLTVDELTTDWIGISAGELYAYRISLHPDGEGFVAFTKRSQDPIVYKIASWEYSKGKIQIKGEPLGKENKNRVPRLSGDVIGPAMTLVDKGSDWKIEVELRRESEMLDWLNRLQEAMANLGTRGVPGSLP